MEYDYESYDGDILSDGEYAYQDEEEEEEGLKYMEEMTYDQLFYSCVKPTLFQTSSSLIYVFLWNIIFRFTSQQRYIPASLHHLFSFASGLLVLHSLFPNTYLLLVILPAFSYLALLLPSRRGVSLLVLSAAFLVFCECVWLPPRLWHQIRGAQMVLIMKAISVGFDIDIGTLQSPPNILQYSGYLFCPGNCGFGPWTSYQLYMSSCQSASPTQYYWRKPYWVLNMCSSLFYGLFFLLMSTCGVHYVFPVSSWKWITAYRDALSFRCSHYFVSYLSEASLLASGHLKGDFDEKYVVARPWHIEMPRSLIQVVVSWNLPMHRWLKIYVFNTTRKLGNFIAVLLTYAVSALLHGLNFQLAAVLLSLGLYSYVEFMLRRKLSQIFSACIQARPCREDCTHAHRWNHPLVLATNFVFTIIAFIHLAYLGVMFDHDESSETGYGFRHTLSKWSDLGFFSHWLALATYVVYFVI